MMARDRDFILGILDNMERVTKHYMITYSELYDRCVIRFSVSHRNLDLEYCFEIADSELFGSLESPYGLIWENVQHAIDEMNDKLNSAEVPPLYPLGRATRSFYDMGAEARRAQEQMQALAVQIAAHAAPQPIYLGEFGDHDAVKHVPVGKDKPHVYWDENKNEWVIVSAPHENIRDDRPKPQAASTGDTHARRIVLEKE